MIFILIHGAFGSPTGNWFPQLRGQLENLGQTVIVPQFPVDSWDEITSSGPEIAPKKQLLVNWLDEFEKTIGIIPKNEKICMIGHSLGPLAILHFVTNFNLHLESAIFVCPFLESLHKSWQIDTANSTFHKTDFDFNDLHHKIPLSYVVYSDNDPYVDTKYSLDFANRLGSQKIPVTGLGHMNSESGVLDFPLVLELCKSRF